MPKTIFAKEKVIQNGAVIKRWQFCGKTFLSKERSLSEIIISCLGIPFHFPHKAKVKSIRKSGKYFSAISRFLEKAEGQKKIVLFSHNLTVTGAPLALYKLALILKESGCQVLIIAPKGGNLEKLLLSQQLDYLIIPHILETGDNFYQKFFAKFDAAICNTYVGAYAAGRLQNILPTLLYIHESKDGLINLANGVEHFLAGLPVTRILQELKHIACVSDFAASFYQPYSQNQIEIIRNFVEDTMQPKYQNTSSVIKIGYVGAIDDKVKKTNVLCEAFAQLSGKYADIELHIIGNTNSEYAQKLKSQYTNRVVWHGEQTGRAKDELFNSFDIVVVPSLSESCSLVALEAAAYSKPVIITENVGAKYMFEHQVSAMICKADDVNSLADCLRELIENKPLRESLAVKARKAYERFATKENTQKELFAVLEKVINNFKRENK